jgi:hypothetical protein
MENDTVVVDTLLTPDMVDASERRDMFAAFALQGLVANGAYHSANVEDLARQAVRFGDAVIAVLDGVPETR